MEEADPRAGLVEPAVELLVELGEAAAHVLEVVGLRVREGIVEAVKLKEDIKGCVTLRLGERVGLSV